MKRRALAHYRANPEGYWSALVCLAGLGLLLILLASAQPRAGMAVIRYSAQHYTGDPKTGVDVWYSPLHFPAFQTYRWRQGTCVCIDVDKLFTSINDHFPDLLLLFGGGALLSGGLAAVGYALERRKAHTL